MRKHKKDRHGYQAIEPDEIFIDAQNLPEFDTSRLEGKIERPIGAKTFRAFLVLIGVMAVLVAGQLVDLQIIRYAPLAKRAEANTLDQAVIIADRGLITDRNGTLLAGNEGSSTTSSRHARIPWVPLRRTSSAMYRIRSATRTAISTRTRPRASSASRLQIMIVWQETTASSSRRQTRRGRPFPAPSCARPRTARTSILSMPDCRKSCMTRYRTAQSLPAGAAARGRSSTSRPESLSRSRATHPSIRR